MIYLYVTSDEVTMSCVKETEAHKVVERLPLDSGSITC
jgi:hypothetical protein